MKMANKGTSPRPSPTSGEGGKAFPKAERNRLIRVIHTAQNKLCLSDEDYRAVLESETGKRSCNEMSEAEMINVIERFRAMGFKPQAGKGKRGKKLSPKSTGTPMQTEQISKIRALWITCHQLGVVENRYEQGLNAWVKRMTGIERVDWLVDAADCNRCIEGLKRMKRRGEEAQREND
jgi:phage gp16-like protein